MFTSMLPILMSSYYFTDLPTQYNVVPPYNHPTNEINKVNTANVSHKSWKGFVEIVQDEEIYSKVSYDETWYKIIIDVRKFELSSIKIRAISYRIEVTAKRPKYFSRTFHVPRNADLRHLQHYTRYGILRMIAPVISS